GGCHNHRIGLYDAFLIKENHIAACGGIAEAIAAAHRIAPGKPVEVEVESLGELEQALAAGVDIVMLDELSLDDMRTAVAINAGRAKLRSEEHTSELQSRENLVCRLLLEKKKNTMAISIKCEPIILN